MYSKLSDEVIKRKMNSLISDDSSDELNKKIKESLLNFTRPLADELCLNAERFIKETRNNRKKLIDEERRKESKEKIIQEEIDDKKELPSIISKQDFINLKNSFGIMSFNENDEPLFNSLFEQFSNVINKYPQLKLYKALYKDQIKYNSDKEYIHKNLNLGFPILFDGLKDYIFTCFRFSVNPLSGNCIYSSLWIVNSELPLFELLGDDYYLFNFTEQSFDSIELFIQDFKKTDSDIYIGEVYLK